MTIEPKVHENDNVVQDNSILIDIIEFPFEMHAPEFGVNSEVIDGTVLHLSALYASEANTVVVRTIDEQPIHLVAENELFESGIVDDLMLDLPSELSGFFYYRFEDDLTLYSQYPIIIL